jgi:endonuclease-3
MVTPALFARYPDAQALAAADRHTLEKLIHSAGFFRAKAKALTGMAAVLVATHGGQVPGNLDALTALPGVGRKTANVVLGHAFKVPGLAVDRHVLRVANRIGLAEGDDPERVEQQLCALLPPREWTRFSDSLILHGRRICKPTPRCDQCLLQQDCRFARDERRDRGATSGRRRKRTSDTRDAASADGRRSTHSPETGPRDGGRSQPDAAKGASKKKNKKKKTVRRREATRGSARVRTPGR